MTSAGQVGFYDGGHNPPSGEEIARKFERLGKTPETLFPIRYKAFRPFKKLHAEGTITGW